MAIIYSTMYSYVMGCLFFAHIIINGNLLNLIIGSLASHSFINPLIASFWFQINFSQKIIVPTFVILIGIFFDIIFYFLGKKLSKHIKFTFEKKNFFYIFARFIPIFGIFAVFFGALFSKNFNKKDINKIIIGNIIFSIVSLVFWGIGSYFEFYGLFYIE